MHSKAQERCYDVQKAIYLDLVEHTYVRLAYYLKILEPTDNYRGGCREEDQGFLASQRSTKAEKQQCYAIYLSMTIVLPLLVVC